MQKRKHMISFATMPALNVSWSVQRGLAGYHNIPRKPFVHPNGVELPSSSSLFVLDVISQSVRFVQRMSLFNACLLKLVAV